MKTLFIFLLLLAAVPFISFANGGDQRVVDGKYFINLSRAPFTPRAGAPTSFLASFANTRNNMLIADDLIVNIRIAKQGGGGASREFLFEEDNLIVKGGILEFVYAFEQHGLHEIFFDFAYAFAPQKIYTVPDFLIDVQKQENPAPNQNLWFMSLGTGIIGLIIGFLSGTMKRKTNS